MHRGARGVVYALIGLATAGLLIWWLVVDLSMVDQAYQHSAADKSDYYRYYADEQIRKNCLTSPGLYEPDCAEQAREAAREAQRREQDLAAQNVTAWWTKIMGIAAIIGMALSGVGVVLVWTTFRETKRTNRIAMKENARSTRRAAKAGDETNRALKASEQSAIAGVRAAVAAQEANSVAKEGQRRQFRPYVYLEEPHIEWDNMPSHNYVGDTAPVTLYFKNYGQSPAKNVLVTARAFIGGIWNEPMDLAASGLVTAVEVKIADIPPGKVKSQSGYTVVGLRESYRDIKDATASVFIVGQIKYAGGDGWDYKTYFRLAQTGDDLFSQVFGICPDWNDAE